jgi:leucyl aminopeptidase
MRYSEQSLPVGVAAASGAELDVDVLVVPVFEGGDGPGFTLADGACGGRLSAAVAARGFLGKPYTTFVAPVMASGWHPAWVLAVGLGPRAHADLSRLRRAATASALAARDRRWGRVAMVLVGFETTLADAAQAAAEGLTLAAHYNGVYKSDPDARPGAAAYTLVAPAGLSRDDAEDFALRTGRGYILGACTNLARSLANEPSNAMTPTIFADIASEIGAAAGLLVDVLDEERIAGLNMGLLLGVAKGSVEPPRVVVLRYEPTRPATPAVLGLVGKGVTFDSGGISIKPSDGMHKMKSDMSGGAAVLAAMKAIAALKPDVRVVAVIPLVENMPGGRALKPGDVLRSADGKSVEVLDTDAEGRLVLGDALWYARDLGATHLVDVATLTGAIGVALGRTTTGLFAAPASWASIVERTAGRAGDRAWLMPVFDDYREQLRSEIADLSNIGGKAAGAITAAIFLKEFTGGLPWAHLDIAGTAWCDEPQPFQPKGPTGVAVRTLVGLALGSADWARGLDQVRESRISGGANSD